jgi:hypothetical protein
MIHCQQNVKFKLLLRLVVGTVSLWHCVLRSVVRISVQSGSGPCVYAVSYIGAGRLLNILISNKTGSVCVYVTLRRVLLTIVAVEER